MMRMVKFIGSSRFLGVVIFLLGAGLADGSDTYDTSTLNDTNGTNDSANSVTAPNNISDDILKKTNDTQVNISNETDVNNMNANNKNATGYVNIITIFSTDGDGRSDGKTSAASTGSLSGDHTNIGDTDVGNTNSGNIGNTNSGNTGSESGGSSGTTSDSISSGMSGSSATSDISGSISEYIGFSVNGLLYWNEFEKLTPGFCQNSGKNLHKLVKIFQPNHTGISNNGMSNNGITGSNIVSDSGITGSNIVFSDVVQFSPSLVTRDPREYTFWKDTDPNSLNPDSPTYALDLSVQKAKIESLVIRESGGLGVSMGQCMVACKSEPFCTGFADQYRSDGSICEIYGPPSLLKSSKILTSPPWTYFEGIGTRPEMGDKVRNTYCFRRIRRLENTASITGSTSVNGGASTTITSVNGVATNSVSPGIGSTSSGGIGSSLTSVSAGSSLTSTVQYRFISFCSTPTDSIRYWKRACQEGISIALNAKCTLTCNRGYVPSSPSGVYHCLETNKRGLLGNWEEYDSNNGRSLQDSNGGIFTGGTLMSYENGQVVACLTEKENKELQEEIRPELTAPRYRLTAPSISWWYQGLDFESLYKSSALLTKKKFTIYEAELEHRVVCNGYEHYPDPDFAVVKAAKLQMQSSASSVGVSPVASSSSFNGNQVVDASSNQHASSISTQNDVEVRGKFAEKLSTNGAVFATEVDVATEILDAFLYSMQMPLRDRTAQIAMCEYNRTKIIVFANKELEDGITVRELSYDGSTIRGKLSDGENEEDDDEGKKHSTKILALSGSQQSLDVTRESPPKAVLKSTRESPPAEVLKRRLFGTIRTDSIRTGFRYTERNLQSHSPLEEQRLESEIERFILTDFATISKNDNIPLNVTGFQDFVNREHSRWTDMQRMQRNSLQDTTDDFVNTLNQKLQLHLPILSVALHSNLRVGGTALANVNSTHGLIKIKKPFRKKLCNEYYSYDNYDGCAFKTTTGLRCQKWESQVPHLHAFSTTFENEVLKMQDPTLDLNSFTLAELQIKRNNIQFPVKDERGYNMKNPYVANELKARAQAIEETKAEKKADSVLNIPSVIMSPNAPTEFGITRFDNNQLIYRASALRQPLPLESNFCRNPDGRNTMIAEKGGSSDIWCLTTHPLLRWDYCRPISIFPVPNVCRVYTMDRMDLVREYIVDSEYKTGIKSYRKIDYFKEPMNTKNRFRSSLAYLTRMKGQKIKIEGTEDNDAQNMASNIALNLFPSREFNFEEFQLAFGRQVEVDLSGEVKRFPVFVKNILDDSDSSERILTQPFMSPLETTYDMKTSCRNLHPDFIGKVRITCLDIDPITSLPVIMPKGSDEDDSAAIAALRASKTFSTSSVSNEATSSSVSTETSVIDDKRSGNSIISSSYDSTSGFSSSSDITSSGTSSNDQRNDERNDIERNEANEFELKRIFGDLERSSLGNYRFHKKQYFVQKNYMTSEEYENYFVKLLTESPLSYPYDQYLIKDRILATKDNEIEFLNKNAPMIEDTQADAVSGVRLFADVDGCHDLVFKEMRQKEIRDSLVHTYFSLPSWRQCRKACIDFGYRMRRYAQAGVVIAGGNTMSMIEKERQELTDSTTSTSTSTSSGTSATSGTSASSIASSNVIASGSSSTPSTPEVSLLKSPTCDGFSFWSKVVIEIPNPETGAISYLEKKTTKDNCMIFERRPATRLKDPVSKLDKVSTYLMMKRFPVYFPLKKNGIVGEEDSLLHDLLLDKRDNGNFNNKNNRNGLFPREGADKGTPYSELDPTDESDRTIYVTKNGQLMRHPYEWSNIPPYLNVKIETETDDSLQTIIYVATAIGLAFFLYKFQQIGISFAFNLQASLTGHATNSRMDKRLGSSAFSPIKKSGPEFFRKMMDMPGDLLDHHGGGSSVSTSKNNNTDPAEYDKELRKFEFTKFLKDREVKISLEEDRKLRKVSDLLGQLLTMQKKSISKRIKDITNIVSRENSENEDNGGKKNGDGRLEVDKSISKDISKMDERTRKLVMERDELNAKFDTLIGIESTLLHGIFPLDKLNVKSLEALGVDQKTLDFLNIKVLCDSSHRFTESDSSHRFTKVINSDDLLLNSEFLMMKLNRIIEKAKFKNSDLKLIKSWYFDGNSWILCPNPEESNPTLKLENWLSRLTGQTKVAEAEKEEANLLLKQERKDRVDAARQNRVLDKDKIVDEKGNIVEMSPASANLGEHSPMATSPMARRRSLEKFVEKARMSLVQNRDLVKRKSLEEGEMIGILRNMKQYSEQHAVLLNAEIGSSKILSRPRADTTRCGSKIFNDRRVSKIMEAQRHMLGMNQNSFHDYSPELTADPSKNKAVSANTLLNFIQYKPPSHKTAKTAPNGFGSKFVNGYLFNGGDSPNTLNKKYNHQQYKYTNYNFRENIAHENERLQKEEYLMENLNSIDHGMQDNRGMSSTGALKNRINIGHRIRGKQIEYDEKYAENMMSRVVTRSKDRNRSSESGMMASDNMTDNMMRSESKESKIRAFLDNNSKSKEKQDRKPKKDEQNKSVFTIIRNLKGNPRRGSVFADDSRPSTGSTITKEVKSVEGMACSVESAKYITETGQYLNSRTERAEAPIYIEEKKKKFAVHKLRKQSSAKERRLSHCAHNDVVAAEETYVISPTTMRRRNSGFGQSLGSSKYETRIADIFGRDNYDGGDDHSHYGHEHDHSHHGDAISPTSVMQSPQQPAFQPRPPGWDSTRDDSDFKTRDPHFKDKQLSQSPKVQEAIARQLSLENATPLDIPSTPYGSPKNRCPQNSSKLEALKTEIHAQKKSMFASVSLGKQGFSSMADKEKTVESVRLESANNPPGKTTPATNRVRKNNFISKAIMRGGMQRGSMDGRNSIQQGVERRNSLGGRNSVSGGARRNSTDGKRNSANVTSILGPESPDDDKAIVAQRRSSLSVRCVAALKRNQTIVNARQNPRNHYYTNDHGKLVQKELIPAKVKNVIKGNNVVDKSKKKQKIKNKMDRMVKMYCQRHIIGGAKTRKNIYSSRSKYHSILQNRAFNPVRDQVLTFTEWTKIESAFKKIDQKNEQASSSLGSIGVVNNHNSTPATGCNVTTSTTINIIPPTTIGADNNILPARGSQSSIQFSSSLGDGNRKLPRVQGQRGSLSMNLTNKFTKNAHRLSLMKQRGSIDVGGSKTSSKRGNKKISQEREDFEKIRMLGNLKDFKSNRLGEFLDTDDSSSGFFSSSTNEGKEQKTEAKEAKRQEKNERKEKERSDSNSSSSTPKSSRASNASLRKGSKDSSQDSDVSELYDIYKQTTKKRRHKPPKNGEENKTKNAEIRTRLNTAATKSNRRGSLLQMAKTVYRPSIDMNSGQNGSPGHARDGNRGSVISLFKSEDGSKDPSMISKDISGSQMLRNSSGGSKNSYYNRKIPKMSFDIHGKPKGDFRTSLAGIFENIIPVKETLGRGLTHGRGSTFNTGKRNEDDIPLFIQKKRSYSFGGRSSIRSSISDAQFFYLSPGISQIPGLDLANFNNFNTQIHIKNGSPNQNDIQQYYHVDLPALLHSTDHSYYTLEKSWRLLERRLGEVAYRKTQRKTFHRFREEDQKKIRLNRDSEGDLMSYTIIDPTHEKSNELNPLNETQFHQETVMQNLKSAFIQASNGSLKNESLIKKYILEDVKDVGKLVSVEFSPNQRAGLHRGGLKRSRSRWDTGTATTIGSSAGPLTESVKQSTSNKSRNSSSSPHSPHAESSPDRYRSAHSDSSPDLYNSPNYGTTRNKNRSYPRKGPPISRLYVAGESTTNPPSWSEGTPKNQQPRNRKSMSLKKKSPTMEQIVTTMLQIDLRTYLKKKFLEANVSSQSKEMSNVSYLDVMRCMPTKYKAARILCRHDDAIDDARISNGDDDFPLSGNFPQSEDLGTLKIPIPGESLLHGNHSLKKESLSSHGEDQVCTSSICTGKSPHTTTLLQEKARQDRKKQFAESRIRVMEKRLNRIFGSPLHRKAGGFSSSEPESRGEEYSPSIGIPMDGSPISMDGSPTSMISMKGSPMTLDDLTNGTLIDWGAVSDSLNAKGSKHHSKHRKYHSKDRKNHHTHSHSKDRKNHSHSHSKDRKHHSDSHSKDRKHHSHSHSKDRKHHSHWKEK